jgi:hypothetical protein
MTFPNLCWAMANSRLTHYHVATAVHMSETRFSRCLSGRAKFLPEERKRLASHLSYPAEWLFLAASPPPRTPDFKSKAAGDRE